MTVGQLIGVILFVVSLFILWKIRLVILLAFTAVVFATVINRMVVRFKKSGLNRSIAIAFSVGIILAFIGGFFAILVPTVIQQLQQLIDLVPEGLERLRQWYVWLQNLIPGRLLADISSLSNMLDRIPGSTSDWFGGFFTIFSNSVDFMLNLLVVIAVTIMLLANPDRYRHIFIMAFPAFYRRRVDEILCKCETNLVGWALGMLFNMTVIGVFSGVGLWILGVRLALVNGLIAGLLTYIPNLGPTLSVIPPAALALLDAPWKAIAVIILYFVIQQVESTVLTPLVMKRQVSLLPAITLLSLITFGIFFGLLGLFLALPLVVVLQVWFKELLVKDILNTWTKNGKDDSRYDTHDNNSPENAEAESAES